MKGNGFFPFDKNMGKIIDRNISKNLSTKYSQKVFGRAKHSETDPRKTTSKRENQKNSRSNC